MSEASATLGEKATVTIVDVLRLRAETQRDEIAYRFLADGEEERGSLTYGELYRRARQIAAELQTISAVGQRALLLDSSELDFIIAFFGCLCAGVIAVPIYAPRINKKGNARVESVVADAQPSVILTAGAGSPAVRDVVAASAGEQVKWIDTNALPVDGDELLTPPAVSGTDIAFLQYTSGSTAAPKGVMVSHANILHNERMIQNAFDTKPGSVIVGWLPLYHDMGLIGNVLQPLYAGVPCILMSPVAFLQRPLRWLQAISRYQATTSGGPNFAYELCMRKIRPEDRNGLDLSSWRVAFNGAEPVRLETLNRFAAQFADCGFRREAFVPCYGLAEATLFVSGGLDPNGVTTVNHGANGNATNGGSGNGAKISRKRDKLLVACGRPPVEQAVRIVSPDSLRQCSTDEVGEIWISGPSVAQGYWRKAKETEETFKARIPEIDEGPFLRTGDLGFLKEGHLFITGRLKDLLIVRGQNYYPQDIELTVEQSHPILQPGSGAAFSVEIEGEERLVVVQEVAVRKDPESIVQSDLDELDALIKLISRSIVAGHELQAFAVVLIRKGTIPKTSSGKIQRHACRDAFLNRELYVLCEWHEKRQLEPILPKPTNAELDGHAPYGLASWLAQEIARIQGIDQERVDLNQPFTAYGLDSLAAIELAHKLQTEFQVEVDVAEFFGDSTITEVIRHATKNTRSPVRKVENGQPSTYPLSYGQRALWFMHRMAPESAAYNISRTFRIKSAVDAEALRDAFQALVDRHPCLRTTIVETAGEPLQHVAEKAKVSFEYHEASGWSETELTEELLAQNRKPFQLAEGPLFRVHVYRAAQDDYVMHVAVHHIVSDLWSLMLLFEQVGKLYEQRQMGVDLVDLEVPTSDCSYADFVAWQREQLAGPEGDRLWSYWKSELSGDLAPLDLPTDRPRPPLQTFRGSSYSFVLNRALCNKLKQLGAKEQTTLFVTLFAAFQALLHRLSGQKDIVVGFPTTGRVRAELGHVAGYFVNALPLRAKFGRAQSFNELLSQTRSRVLGALSHDLYPFALMVEKLGIGRDSLAPPVFQSILSFQSTYGNSEDFVRLAVEEPGVRLRLGDLQLEPVRVPEESALLDLVFTVAEGPEGLSGTWQYNSDLFEQRTIARWVESFYVLLEGIVSSPETSVSRLGLLSEKDRTKILEEFNPAELAFDQQRCVHQEIEQQTKLISSKIAIAYRGRELSYHELNAQANRVARYLRRMGVGKGDLVGIFMRRTPQMVAAMLGVWKAGAGYVPLDPQYPPERLRFMLQDAAPKLVITTNSVRERVGEIPSKILYVDEEREQIEKENPENLDEVLSSGQVAYVIYTSGSTGAPKGVMLAHQSAMSFVTWVKSAFQQEELEGVLAASSIGSDLSIFELWATLSCGGTVVLTDDLSDWWKHLDEENPLHPTCLINAIPSALTKLIQQGPLPDSVRTVNLAGEAVQETVVSQLSKAANVRHINNLYGQSETTTYSTWTAVRAGEPVRIGQAAANTQLYVLDEEQELIPIGIPGELYIGGEGVAQGYWKRASLTAERFLPNPFGKRNGARMYRTGDVVRWQENGQLEYLGRADQQVRLRGYRVELGEIEGALLKHPGVAQAAVVARADRTGVKRLMGYVVSREKLDLGQLRSYLQQRLPEYMVPSAFQQLDSLPLTPNGKVDRKTLAEPEEREPVVEQSGDVALTPTEELIAGMWSSLLGKPDIRRDDNFFDLGGHSLLVTQVISRLRELFQVELPLQVMFEAPTVSGLARSIENSTRIEAPPLRRRSRQERIPLSFGQERLRFLSRYELGTSLYNVPVAVRLKGALNVEAAKASLQEMVNRHEVLRTSFPEIGDSTIQDIAAEMEMPFAAAEIREDELDEMLRGQARQSFDLSNGPLIRASLFHISSQDHVLLVVTHHIVSDGWSLGVMLREFNVLYDSFSRGAASPLPPLPIQYADYSEWQREWLQGEVLERQLDYWREQLAGHETLSLPTDRPHSARPTLAGAMEIWRLPEPLVSKLKSLSDQQGVTLFMTLLTAFEILLYRYTGRTDISVGSAIANRSRQELEPLIGFFVNTLVLRTRFTEDSSVAELLQRVRNVSLQAYAHQDIPFERLVEALDPARELSRTPFFQAVFALQNTPLPTVSWDGLEATASILETGTAKFDLTLSAREEDGELELSLEYRTELFNAERMKRLLQHYRTLLEGIVASVETRISEMEMLSELERQQLLVDWNRTEALYSTNKCVHQLFEEQAARGPQAVAAIVEDRKISYAELNRQANQLAHYLTKMGVGQEVRVGICMERNLGMVVALMGILKAGGVCVPLDPADPSARRSHMVKDAGATLVLTNGQFTRQMAGCTDRVVDLEEARKQIEKHSGDNLKVHLDVENLAWVIYTSSSAGQPMGTAIPHRGAASVMQRTLIDAVDQYPSVERLLNLYGPTEDVTYSCYTEVHDDEAGLETLGRPLSNAEAYVLDRHMKLVPVGIKGELYISGSGRARGYLNRPEFTAEKFVPNPFSKTGGERLYRTGDLVRRQENGKLEFLGRLDSQVKMQGYRIEPGEIEAALLDYPRVTQTAVITRENKLGDMRLVGYVAGNERLDIEQLRSHLHQHLPEYMVPVALLQLDTLPLTANGKVDRKALIELESKEAMEEAGSLALTPTEELIAGVWSSLLGKSDIRRDDNFFDLGGHSLLVTQMLSRLRQVFNREIDLRAMFESPVLKDLSAYVDRLTGSSQLATLRPILPTSRDGDLPLSLQQEQLWFLEQITAGSTAYSLPGAVRLRGDLDKLALRLSLEEIVRRHEILRTSFVQVDAKPKQRFHEAGNFEFVERDLRETATGVAPEEKINRELKEEATFPFLLSEPNLFRAKLLRVAEREYILLLTLHHIVFDGWSVGVMADELGQLYKAYHEDRPSPLPDLPIQYADYTVWQRELVAEGELTDGLEYWKQQLEDLSDLDLPTDHPRPATQSFRGTVERWEMSPEVSAAIRKVSQDQGVTLFMTLLAGFQILLARYSGQRDIVVGSPIANRAQPELEPLIGFFVNTLVLRGTLNSDLTVEGVLQHVREACLGAYAHQSVPFERLVDELQPERDLSRSPLFQVMLVLQNAPVSALQMHGVEIGMLPSATSGARFDLTLMVEDDPVQLRGMMEYCTDLYERATVRRMLVHYQQVLTEIARDPGQLISTLPLLGPAERQQLLTEWNCPFAELQQSCLHELFEQQARLTPNARAIEHKDHSLTYSEFNQRANQLGHYLNKLGIGSEELVGILLPRCSDLLVAMLGVLKAGAAYVFLNPDDREQLAYILDDAKPEVVIGQQHLSHHLRAYAGKAVYSDTEWNEINQESGENIEAHAHPENLAYVTYRSESEKASEGVAVQHGNVTVLVRWAQSMLSVDDLQRVLTSNPPISELSILDTYVPLCCGGTVVVMEDSLETVDIAESAGVALINSAPSAMRELIRRKSLPPSVHTIVLAGEPVPSGLARRIFDTSDVKRVLNLYGHSEMAYCSTAAESQTENEDRRVSIGRPVKNTQAFVLDAQMQLVPAGVEGELYVTGTSLTRGYFNRADLTADRFIPNPFSGAPGERLYRTGDLARYSTKGDLELRVRSGQKIRIGGHRVDLEEVETALERQPEVVDAVVLVQQTDTDEDQLVAYVVPQNVEAAANSTLERTLRVALKQRLPEYMVPSHWISLERLPMRPDGKLDRSALPAVHAKSQPTQSVILPVSDTEKTVTAIWKQVLKIDEVGVEDNFFDVGGQSLMIPEVHGALQKQFGTSLTVVELFQYSTIRALAERLDSEKTQVPQIAPAMVAEIIETEQPRVRTKGLAVIGMACRFPGARNIEEFWNNLQAGVESTVEFSDEELREAGVAESVFTSPTYVKHSAILDDVDLFDARFFNMSAREAELVDPQQRALLECAWEALEDAGYSSETYKGSVGIYAGSGAPTYLLNLGIDHKAMDPNDATPMLFANTNDLLATRVAYKLNLTGPSITVQTACSTSLVTVHVACRALLNQECDLALAGGVTIRTPQVMGDSFMEGGIVSPDGHCRTFDEHAQGTVRSNGVGIVVLKRLEDALRDRDCIHAIIRGSAINNDGSQKVGFAAPSVSGQRDVIQRALRDSGVEPETISYVEAHGTATPMGDPIEVTALTQAFRGSTAEKGFCAVGSVKSNIGHTDCAAGVAGLIKTVLALEHKQIPATLNFQRPNSMIDFANSPFYVNATLSEWKTNGRPRRAGVSSFGIGGTNAHAVLEEAPTVDSGKETRPYQMLLLSAKTSTALEATTANLAAYLESHKDVNLADVAYTLHLGRREFSHRRVIVGKDPEDALEVLHSLDVKRVVTGFQEPKTRPVVFMFPGQGAQYVNMAAGLYGGEPVFKQEVDRCATILQEHLGLDLRDVLYPKPDEINTSESATRLLQTQITQPALFVIEYALARLWMDWGVQPHAMVGHSIGEYVAACLAGVFSLEDALALVAARGRWMQSLPSGSMLVVPLPENEVIPLLGDGLSLAAVNSPDFSVVSGPAEDVDRLEQELTAKKLACRRLQTSHAFHSAMMDPILESFATEFRRVRMQAPQLPYMSNLTGTWITEDQATSPEYWVQHLRKTVRFADCVRELVKDPDWVLLEVGPGRTLSTLARWNPYRAQGQVVVNSVRHPDDLFDDEAFLLLAAGKLWMTGAQFDWPRFYQHEQRKRVSLPTYHFERQRYWIEPKKKTTSVSPLGMGTEKNKNSDEWFYVPSWKRTALNSGTAQESSLGSWLIFSDRFGFGERLKSEAQSRGIEVFSVTEGSQYAQVADSFTVCSQEDSDYQSLFKALKQSGKLPSKVLYLWTIADADHNSTGEAQSDLERSFYSPLFLAQAIGSLANASPTEWVMVSNSLYDVIGESIHHPERATLLGPCHVVPQEYPNVSCRNVDFDFSVRDIPLTDAVTGLVEEIVNGSEEKVVAYRKGKRWAQVYEHLRLPADDRNVRLREKGIYLLTGGLGGIGLAIAEHLAETFQARLVLVGRSQFPQREEWEGWLETHTEQDEVSSKIRKLQSLEKMGAEVLVVSADVSDEQQMRPAIAHAQEQFGPLNGVVHCAGVPGGGVIQLKTREIAEAVLAPKVKGTMVLASVLNKTPLDFFAVCSSRSSITGSFGQVDYCAANAFQDAFAHFSHQNGLTSMIAINWDAWANVGMLANAVTPSTMQAESIPDATGEKVDHPFFDVRMVESPDREVYVTTMSPLTHWVLDEHRIAGNPIIPGTAYLEMVRAAVEKYSNGRDIEIRDVFFLAPLGLREDEKREVRLILEKQGAGYTFRIVSKVGEDSGAEARWNDYSTGTVAFVEQKRKRPRDLETIKRRCNLQQVAFTDESKRDEDLGPRWQTLKQAYVGHHELLAVFELPGQFMRDFEKLKMHPSLLDRSMEIGKHFLFPVGVYLPMGYRRLTIKQPLGKRIYTHVVFDPAKRQDGETMLCDVTIFDEHGEELLEIDSFSQKRVNDIAAQIKAVAKKQYRRSREESTESLHLANASAGVKEQGLTVREGVMAFRRILQVKSEPQVIVSTNDLQTMILQAGSLRPMAEMLAQAADAPVAAGSRHPRPAIATPYQAPNTPVERKIAEVWQQVLGIDQIGVNDNIFDLGGDSVQGIQIVARINQQGFQLTAAQLFEHQTIASLAAVASTSETIQAEQGEIVGDVSITPVQRGFLEQHHPAIQHYNHSVLLNAPVNANMSVFRHAVSFLMSHHDALRTRFELVASEWHQTIVSSNEEVPFSEVDLSKHSQADQLVEFDREVARLQASLDLAHGPLFRAVFFSFGTGAPGRLMLIAHSLVADRLSMAIIVEDLNLAYQQLLQGTDVHLAEKTTSYQYWASKLSELADSPTILEESSEWLNRPRSTVADLPVDLPGGNNTVQSEVCISRSLESEETRNLLQDATAVNHSDVSELLLTALARSLSKWATSNDLLVDSETHGREELFPNVNLSRTVGAFATAAPVLLQKLHLEELAQTLQSVKEQVRRIPRHGIGYGLLRYQTEDLMLSSKLKSMPQPQIKFSYLGNIEQKTQPNDIFRRLNEPVAHTRDPRTSRGCVFEVSTFITDGKLGVKWDYSSALHSSATADKLADDFMESVRELIALSASTETETFSPSDFPLAGLDEKGLLELENALAEADESDGKSGDNSSQERTAIA